MRRSSGLDRRRSPRILSVALPPRYWPEAAPKCISGSTSSLRVCLAFHSYAQVIRKLFNAYRCGPPDSVTCPSSCPCVDHSVSRLPPSTKRPLQTRFRSGSGPEALSLANDGNSQVHYAKGTPSPYEMAPTACRRMVSGSFSLLCSRCFSPFPHGTRSLSVSR